MNRIKELREQNGWLQKDLEQKLNLGKGNVSKYETEVSGLSPELINQFCDLFQCTADYLLCRSDTPIPIISKADAALIKAYHAANLRDRGIIDQILQAYAEDDQQKDAI